MTKRIFRQGGRRVGARDLSTGAPILPTFTVAQLPAATNRAGQLIYVSDGTANKRLAVIDGTNARFPDGAVVS